MLNKLMKKFSQMANKAKKSPATKAEQALEANLSSDIRKNITLIRNVLGKNDDFIVREFMMGTDVKAAVIYLSTMADKNVINKDIIKPLMIFAREVKKDIPGTKSTLEIIKDYFLTISEIEVKKTVDEVVMGILVGDVALVIDGEKKSLIIEARKQEKRAIEEPPSETVIRGPRDGFNEQIKTNVSLIRNRIRDPKFTVELYNLGRRSRTETAITYIEGVADPKVVDEVRKRIKSIDVDDIMATGYIEELIKDDPYTPFPTMLSTERPDKIVAGIMEGRVAIIVDNTPFSLMVPMVFMELLQSPDDYFNNFYFGSAIRLMRFLAMNITLLLPSLYVAITTYHQEMIPTSLLISIIGAREGVPFPAFVEALLMEATFELLREAGVRLPRPFGQAISIVGALVIGQAAVQAGLISPAMVIVVSVTAIASFTIPNYAGSNTIRLLRFPIILLAGVLGLFGVIAGLVAILIHVASLRSFGVPYMAPLAPAIPADMKDTLIRKPRWSMNTRPKIIGGHNPVREAKNQRPKTSANKDKELAHGSKEGG